MRNVISTHSRADVSEEYAEQVDKVLDAYSAERSTTSDNQWGQTDFSVRLYTYEAPGTGETMWAVDYIDPATRELEETPSREEAVARYEELVRDAADNLGIDDDGYQERFTTTDVDGVPGPLPKLPTVTTSQVDRLLDADGTPVLYLDLDDDGAPVLRIGPASEVPEDQVVLTRSQVLDKLHLNDTEGRVTSGTVDKELDMEFSLIALDATKEGVRAAADVLFTAETA
ncbi:hypothetical protein ACF1AB_39345 [Streptomyces sp. NPDC014846]|uniref:hypothetical protein n=1 Tax=Streptomyces sp. NPDC014846 TaxID=3364922 RepID=UPI003702413A